MDSSSIDLYNSYTAALKSETSRLQDKKKRKSTKILYTTDWQWHPIAAFEPIYRALNVNI